MKKIYFLFALLLSFVGVTHVFAQDDEVITIKVDANSGDYVSWNGNTSNPWARSWQSTSENPRVTVTGGANNFRPHDGTNFQFFNCVGGSGKSHNYVFTVTSGYEFVSISLDFCSSADDNAEVYVAIDTDPSGSGDADEVANVSNKKSEVRSVNHEFDPETYTFAMVVGANASSKFANTTNLVVKVRKADEYAVAEQALMEALEKYEPYTQEGLTPFQYGTYPGDYTEESVIAFETCIANVMDEYDNTTLTAERIYELIASLDAAYEAVLASKQPLTLADGYYRFRTGLNYSDGQVKYMYVEPGETISGKWGFLDTAEGNARFLWKLTKVETKDGEDIFDFVSVATDARFNDNPGTLSSESEWRFVLEPVVTVDGTTYVNIKYADRDPGTNNRIYVHQAGHGSGAGHGGNLTIWSPSYSTDAETGAVKMGGSEWAIVPVTDTDAAKIIEDYPAIRDAEKLVADSRALKAEIKEALIQAKDIQEYTYLITDGSQFSSPWTETSEGVGKSGDWNQLLDGNLSTYWHSDWSKNVAPHTHYLEVALNEPVYSLVEMKISRRSGAGNDHITLWGVYGANAQDIPDVLYTEEEATAYNTEHGLTAEDEGYVNAGDVKVPGTPADWEELASLATPYGSNTETKISDEFDTKGYQYLRFYIDDTTTKASGTDVSRGYGHVSEFQLQIPVTNPKSQYAYMGEIATNLEALYRELAKIEDENITKEQYESLVAAYDAFKAQFVDPTELRNLLAEVESIAKGVVVGTQPGYWASSATGDALNQTYTEAKQYDEDGIYIANKSNEFIATLQTQVEAVKASANKIQEGKWYRIHFGSKETFEANEWDIETNDDQIVADEYVVNESLWNKYITVAKRETEDVKYNVETTNEETGETTSEEKTATINKIVAYDEDAVIVRGAQLFFDADEDIQDKDFSLFRFVNVGDTAYVLQNKATGLFLRAENTTLDVIPSLFNVSAIGYGQNLIAASNIITGKSQSNLHFQRAQNRVVTYGENTAGSRSGLYIEEVSDVESDYEGTEFFMNLKPGSMHAFCFPVDLQPVEDEMSGHEYVFYDVASVADGVVKLNEIQEANAGRPFIFIVDGEYVEEAEDASAVAFKHGYEFTDEAISSTLLKGTYSTLGSLDKGIIAVQPSGFVVNKSNISSLGGVTVNAYSAYIVGEEAFPIDVNYTYEIVEGIADGIETTLQKVAKTGDIYTLDGRLITRRGNLNTLRGLGKGIYIVNGVKVVVK